METGERGMSEYDEQATVVSWFRQQYPKYAGCLWATVNERQLRGNAGQRMGQVKKLKKIGYKAGVSDLQLMIPRGGYHGLFIEMKDAKKTQSSVSSSQRQHLALMASKGYRAAWCPGADDGIRVITDYMGL